MRIKNNIQVSYFHEVDFYEHSGETLMYLIDYKNNTNKVDGRYREWFVTGRLMAKYHYNKDGNIITEM